MKAYWEENDYYSSDEDTFLDRTGQIEVRRRMRMRRLGVDDASNKEDDSASKKAAEDEQDSLTLVSISFQVCCSVTSPFLFDCEC